MTQISFSLVVCVCVTSFNLCRGPLKNLQVRNKQLALYLQFDRTSLLFDSCWKLILCCVIVSDSLNETEKPLSAPPPHVCHHGNNKLELSLLQRKTSDGFHAFISFSIEPHSEIWTIILIINLPPERKEPLCSQDWDSFLFCLSCVKIWWFP